MIGFVRNASASKMLTTCAAWFLVFMASGAPWPCSADDQPNTISPSYACPEQCPPACYQLRRLQGPFCPSNQGMWSQLDPDLTLGSTNNIPSSPSSSSQTNDRSSIVESGQDAFAPNMIGDFLAGSVNQTGSVLVPTQQSVSTFFTSNSSVPNGVAFYYVNSSSIPPWFTGPGVTTTTTTSALPNSQPNISGTPGNYVTPGAGHPALQIANGVATINSVSYFGPNPTDTQGTATVSYTTFTPTVINLPMPGATLSTVKIAENSSPLPRDRVYFNYSYFDGVPLSANGINVNRFTPGFEKTFFGGWASLEVRTPFATSLSNSIYADGITNSSMTQFGNVTMYLKQLVYKSETFAASGGLGFELPTANNVGVYSTTGQQLVGIKNQSVHLLPFLGTLYTPNERFFTQQFLQFDFDTNGNAVSVADTTGAMQSAGRINDMTYLYYSIGTGYWAYNNPKSRGFTRIAPMVELHYNKSLSSSDVVSNYGYAIGAAGQNVDLLNGTIGATALMGQNKTLTAAYVTPLTQIDQREFNGEFRLFFNWFFGGPTNRLSRVQF